LVRTFDDNKLVIDMVHHNPAEKKFETEFLDPRKCFKYGYNGQVFKHISCAVSFEQYDEEICPKGSQTRIWIDNLTTEIADQISKAKQAGLQMFYHIDLFILPTVLVQKYKDQICDEKGRISINKSKTLEIHRALFSELFNRFDIDGLIIRMGETYTWESPFHTGNSPVNFADQEQNKLKEIEAFAKTINFLREEICQRYNKILIIRTWDTKIDRFHANEDYYLQVTDQVPSHSKLYFSIKHTKLDFYKPVDFNPCLCKGEHQQIIEVQCQREYEGKGAFPNYVMREIIEGEYDSTKRKGLRDIIKDERIKGLYTWSRGGGFFGPYIKNEFWCDMHAWIISKWFRMPEMDEEKIFYEYTQTAGFDGENSRLLRQICLLSSKAVLKGHYCSVAGSNVDLKYLLWTRDDRIGGFENLTQVFEEIVLTGNVDAALTEKAAAVSMFRDIVSLSKKLKGPSEELTEFIRVSCLYGLHYFSIIYHGWRVMLLGYTGDNNRQYDIESIRNAIKCYDSAWQDFNKLTSNPLCATLYADVHWSWPGENKLGGDHNKVNFFEPGIGQSVNRYRHLARAASVKTAVV